MDLVPLERSRLLCGHKPRLLSTWGHVNSRQGTRVVIYPGPNRILVRGSFRRSRSSRISSLPHCYRCHFRLLYFSFCVTLYFLL